MLKKLLGFFISDCHAISLILLHRVATVMISLFSIPLGIQFLLQAINIDIAALEKKESLQDYMKEDLEYDLKYREALLVVIGNFSTEDEMTKVCNGT